MPRDSSGNYTLPLGNPVIDGTVIDVNWANPTMSDIAVQLNNVLTRDGLLSPTGAMYFTDGTPALPGIAFAAAHGTGFWRDAIQMGVSWQGDPKMLWGASGARTVGNLTVTGDLAVTGVGPYVLKAGDTMIGPLTVNTAAGAVVQLALTSNDPISGGIFFRQAAALRGIIGFGAGYLPPSAGPSDFGVRSEAALLFSAGSVERMRIDSAGNVGIGVVPNTWGAAFRALQITGASLFADAGGLANYLTSNLIHDGTNWRTRVIGEGAAYGQNTGYHYWYTAPSVAAGAVATPVIRMVVDPTGNVGIGTTAPTVAGGIGLAIYGGAGQTRIALKNATTGDAFADGFQVGIDTSGEAFLDQRENLAIRFTTNAAERMRIDAGGTISSVGPLTLGPTPFAGSSSRLQLTYNTAIEHCIGIKPNTDTGPGNAIIFYNNAGTQVGGITTSSTNTAYITSSDARLKSSIVAAQDVGHVIDALFVREFEFRSEPGIKHIGFIAQELVEVVPEAVHKGGENPDTHPWGVDTSPVIPLLVREIQSLRARLTAGGL